MADNDILQEVRAARDEYCRQFDYDIAAIGRELREQELTCGRRVVSFPPRRPFSLDSEAPENLAESIGSTTQAAASPAEPPFLIASHSSQE